MTAKAPTSSFTDLSFFFDAVHGDAVARAGTVVANWTLDHGQDLAATTRRAVAQLADAGLMGFVVPEAFGGAAVGRPQGVDTRAVALIRETLAWADGLLDNAFVMQGLGSYPITLEGSAAQKAKYLPGILSGARVAAFALTEPGAGSDVAALCCHARSHGDEYILDGEKIFITNAGVASQYVVFATVDPDLGRKGISAFVVEPDDPGFRIEQTQVIAPHPIGRLVFEGCRIPAERRLGEEGIGFKLAMRTLDVFRTTVGGAALGMARRALDESLDRALARQQFGGPIFDKQQIMTYIADGATELDAARLLVFRGAHARDTEERRVSKEVAMGKLYATEVAQKIIDRAVQIHGGLGVTVGSAVERLYREIRPLRIYEGSSEIQKVVIGAALRRERTRND